MSYLYILKKNFKNLYNLKYVLNYKFLLFLGVPLGGHKKLLKIRTSAIIYASRNNFFLLKIQKTLYELLKILKLIEMLGFTRKTIFFINSYLGFRFLVKTLTDVFNYFHIANCNNQFLKNRIYIISKWAPGFLTNLKFLKIKKLHLPYFGFIGNHCTNFITVNEFNQISVPYCSLVDSVTENLNNLYYTIIGNIKSIDSTCFFLFNILNALYIGYSNEKLKFLKKLYNLNINQLEFKKQFFFKRYLLLKKVSII